MGDRTGIEWTDATLNAIRGCQHVSAGCDNCYAASIALRFSGPGLPYEGLAVLGPDGKPAWTGAVMLIPEKLQQCLSWTRPRRVFVNSMSDLFYARIPRAMVDQHFATFAVTPRHQYQVLTKRPDRMARYLGDPDTPRRVGDIIRAMQGRKVRGATFPEPAHQWWPIPNVWVGTSIENQEAAYRLGDLLDCEASVRFLSCEPLIGPLDLGPRVAELQWVIVGGESGKDYRPIRQDWVRSLRDQCRGEGVPFFFKQWGGLKPKSNGKVLDGREWCEFPVELGA